MLTKNLLRTGSLLVLSFVATNASAAISAAEAAKLGKSLTPLGAVKSANKNGTIPAWSGGTTKPPPGYKQGDHHPDPFASDKILFTITAANANQYKDKLSAGQLALLKTYPTYKMHVYPTHRSASFPQRIYDATIGNATKARLVADGNGVPAGDGNLILFGEFGITRLKLPLDLAGLSK